MAGAAGPPLLAHVAQHHLYGGQAAVGHRGRSSFGLHQLAGAAGETEDHPGGDAASGRAAEALAGELAVLGVDQLREEQVGVARVHGPAQQALRGPVGEHDSAIGLHQDRVGGGLGETLVPLLRFANPREGAALLGAVVDDDLEPAVGQAGGVEQGLDGMAVAMAEPARRVTPSPRA